MICAQGYKGNVVIKPSEFREEALKEKVEKFDFAGYFRANGFGWKKLALWRSVSQSRSQPDVHQQFDSIDIGWTAIGEQLLDRTV